MKLKLRRECLFHITLFIAAGFGSSSTVIAQNVDRISRREIERRQAALPQGVEALARAQAAMQTRNYVLAHDEFRNALNMLPDAATSEKSHEEALAGFCQSGVKVAEQQIADGRFEQAEA